MGAITIKPGETFLGTLGAETDAAGNVVTSDPVVSASWTVDVPDVSLSASADGLSVTGAAAPGFLGTANVSVQATTHSGLVISGSGSVTVAEDPPAAVAVDLSVVAPPPAA